ncbi:hypothetical protein Ddye_001307 [Dipteronia dyeriana]|uniref:Uncharacterized protein n=1 Tax=Dipteronia dyeriana TaxID=168575 RepID=A0AAD9XNW7_9ROSI|nr:hypothetical protein Ddye_001307 [Dipteronia dyeriana]
MNAIWGFPVSQGSFENVRKIRWCFWDRLWEDVEAILSHPVGSSQTIDSLFCAKLGVLVEHRCPVCSKKLETTVHALWGSSKL